MEFVRRGSGREGTGRPETVALFPGAWNPPTRAHVAMAEAALSVALEVVFVLPRWLPHKPFEGPGFEERLAWLERIAQSNPAFSVAVSDGGLFFEMARELRDHASDARVLLLCGSDAADRIVTWDYGEREGIEGQLREFELLVAPRPAPYAPPVGFVSRIHALWLPQEYVFVSSTEVRDRIRRGEDAAPLVPGEIMDDVLRRYAL